MIINIINQYEIIYSNTRTYFKSEDFIDFNFFLTEVYTNNRLINIYNLVNNGSGRRRFIDSTLYNDNSTVSCLLSHPVGLPLT